MKKLTYLCCLITLCTTAFLSCKEEVEEFQPDPAIINPLTTFEYTKDPVDGFKFHFKNTSKDYKRVEWRFGDDSLRTTDEVTHVYAGTGKYNVELRTFSETGTVSRSVTEIEIKPDSILQIFQEKSGVLHQVKYSIKLKGEVKSVQWSFSNPKPAGTSDLLTPLVTYVPGTLNTVTAKVTTKEGSVVTLTKPNATTEGFVKNITLEREKYEVSAENNYLETENSVRILDNNIDSKFVIGGRVERAFTYPYMVTLTYPKPQTVKLYVVGSSNDLQARDPKSWRVEGSNDGLSWEVLDTRTMAKNFYDQMGDLGGVTAAERYKQLFYYPIATPKAFTKYRWAITANWGDAAMQINDFRLFH